MSEELIAEAQAVAYSLRDILGQPEMAKLVDRIADALERAEKERAAERWWCQDCGRLMAERDRLRAENERLEDRVTTLEERLRHMADDFSARDVPASVPPERGGE